MTTLSEDSGWYIVAQIPTSKPYLMIWGTSATILRRCLQPPQLFLSYHSLFLRLLLTSRDYRAGISNKKGRLNKKTAAYFALPGNLLLKAVENSMYRQTWNLSLYTVFLWRLYAREPATALRKYEMLRPYLSAYLEVKDECNENIIVTYKLCLPGAKLAPCCTQLNKTRLLKSPNDELQRWRN